jgi:hypothetical protein
MSKVRASGVYPNGRWCQEMGMVYADRTIHPNKPGVTS